MPMTALPSLEKTTALALLNYCRSNDWAGYDPYDALNSRLFEWLPFLNSKLPRLCLTQALKRSPINLRRWLWIPKTQNPKALGLFLEAFIQLSKLGLLEESGLVEMMVAKIASARSPDQRYWCWGYSFAWQTRTLIVPRAAPSLVCTVFVGNALLSAYEYLKDDNCLRMAVSAAEYIRNELFCREGESVACLRYPTPHSTSRIHNANFLGAAFLSRVALLAGEEKFLEPALSVARYSAARQQEDGSWPYGELPSQRWIDNFHTGYNLCALRALGSSLKTNEFEPSIRRGYDFYADHFFRKDGIPAYFHDRTYPVDAHCVAQSIITLSVFRDLRPEGLDLAHRVFGWAMDRMWDSKGFFYYRVYPGWRIKTSYMRWVQAWMLLAISTLLTESGGLANGVGRQRTPQTANA